MSTRPPCTYPPLRATPSRTNPAFSAALCEATPGCGEQLDALEAVVADGPFGKRACRARRDTPTASPRRHPVAHLGDVICIGLCQGTQRQISRGERGLVEGRRRIECGHSRIVGGEPDPSGLTNTSQ